jgi:hypothetical protein
LIKQLGERGPLRISDEPAQIGDVGATICKDVGDCQSLGGIPLDELPGSRNRPFFQYEWVNEFWESTKIEVVKAFDIKGPVWQLASWSRLRPPSLELDRDISFQKTFPAHDLYFDWGWSGQEDWGAWSDGPTSSLSFSLPAPARQPLELVVDTQVYLRPDTPTLSVSAMANGTPIGQWQFDFPQKTATLHAVIQPNMWTADGRMQIQMDFERKVALDQVPNAPSRMIAIGIRSLRLQHVAASR